MFLLSIAGAAVAPLVVVVATYVNEPSTPFKELFYNVNLYTVLIIGAPFYGVVTTYLFNREYVENTIKNILTITVSRLSFIISKTLLLFMWIMMLIMFILFVFLFCCLFMYFFGFLFSIFIN